MSKKYKKIEKSLIYRLNYQRLREIYMSLFVYKNMPKEINLYAMEDAMLRTGFAIFFYDKDLSKYFAMEGARAGVDVYGYPNAFTPISKVSTITFNTLSIDECVPMLNTKYYTPFTPVLRYYAGQLTEVDMAININVNMLKKPVKGSADDKTIASITNALNKYDDGYTLLVNTDTISNALDAFKPFEFGITPTEILNLLKVRETILNNFFARLGITGGIEKRERIITTEISNVNSQTRASKDVLLKPRQDAIEKINAKYGLNVSVEYANDIEEVMNNVELNNQTIDNNRNDISEDE